MTLGWVGRREGREPICHARGHVEVAAAELPLIGLGCLARRKRELGSRTPQLRV
jgi:hypothetical protein